MKIDYSPEKIIFNKELRAIDQFVFSFVPYLDYSRIKYVLISGYVFLFFGRDRSTEDVDIFVEDMDNDKFLSFWNHLSDKFECLNAQSAKSAYDLFTDGVALRFHRKGSFIPNIEFKPLKTDLDRYSLENRIRTECNNKAIYLPPLELQIAFKLWLGSEKDMEDARFLYKLLKEHLKKNLLREMLKELRIESTKFKSVMGEGLE